jgi:hypothetical protein
VKDAGQFREASGPSRSDAPDWDGEAVGDQCVIGAVGLEEKGSQQVAAAVADGIEGLAKALVAFEGFERGVRTDSMWFRGEPIFATAGDAPAFAFRGGREPRGERFGGLEGADAAGQRGECRLGDVVAQIRRESVAAGDGVDDAGVSIDQ